MIKTNTGKNSLKIIAAILAGGKASRMDGIAKGLLVDAANVPWIERLIDELAKAGIREVVLSANGPQPYLRFGKTVVADRHAGVGPLGGIEAVLHHLAGRCDAVLFAPCDLPNFSAAEIRLLIQTYAMCQAKAGKKCVVMAETLECEHPLCAVVPTSVSPEISAAIEAGNYSVVRLWKTLGAVAVRVDKPERLTNINTHEDLLRWQQTAGSNE
jgi:molybdenum cofactor guanylyltransferase